MFRHAQRFKLWPETVYITINLLDRYLSQVDFNPDQTYLLICTCLFIASKYEEIDPPSVRDLIKISKN